MARRYDHSPEELMELALSKGSQMLDEVGYHNFSSRGAATSMGYTVGTLYHLFDNQDMYILHINARTLDEWYEFLSAKLKTAKKDPIMTLAKGYLEYAGTHPNRFFALFEHRVAKVPDWYKPKMHRFFLLVETLLRERGMTPAKASHHAKVLWASVHGITTLSLTGKLDLVGASAAETLIKTALEGLLAGV